MSRNRKIEMTAEWERGQYIARRDGIAYWFSLDGKTWTDGYGADVADLIRRKARIRVIPATVSVGNSTAQTGQKDAV